MDKLYMLEFLVNNVKFLSLPPPKKKDVVIRLRCQGLIDTEIRPCELDDDAKCGKSILFPINHQDLMCLLDSSPLEMSVYVEPCKDVIGVVDIQLGDDFIEADCVKLSALAVLEKDGLDTVHANIQVSLTNLGSNVDTTIHQLEGDGAKKFLFRSSDDSTVYRCEEYSSHCKLEASPVIPVYMMSLENHAPLRLTGGSPVCGNEKIPDPKSVCQDLMDEFNKLLTAYKNALGPCGKPTCPYAPHLVADTCKAVCSPGDDDDEERAATENPVATKANIAAKMGDGEIAACAGPTCPFKRDIITPADAQHAKLQAKPACGLPTCPFIKEKFNIEDLDYTCAPVTKCPYVDPENLPPIHWDCPDPLPKGDCCNPNCPIVKKEKLLKKYMPEGKGQCNSASCPYAVAPCIFPGCPFRQPEPPRDPCPPICPYTAPVPSHLDCTPSTCPLMDASVARQCSNSDCPYNQSTRPPPPPPSDRSYARPLMRPDEQDVCPCTQRKKRRKKRKQVARACGADDTDSTRMHQETDDDAEVAYAQGPEPEEYPVEALSPMQALASSTPNQHRSGSGEGSYSLEACTQDTCKGFRGELECQPCLYEPGKPKYKRAAAATPVDNEDTATSQQPEQKSYSLTPYISREQMAKQPGMQHAYDRGEPVELFTQTPPLTPPPGEVLVTKEPVAKKKRSSKTSKASKGSRKRRRRCAAPYVYDKGTFYPGTKIGHKNCVQPRFNVPPDMGWLWNVHTQCLNLKPRLGWKPGAISRTIATVINKHRARMGLHPMETMSVTKRRARAAQEEHDEHQHIKIKPTLQVKKKDGIVYVTMNPLKDPKTLADNENPYMDCTPMQFKIIKNKQNEFNSCLHYEDGDVPLSSSSSSELDIEFTPPAGIIRPERLRKKKNVAHVDTQYDPKDCATVKEHKKEDNGKGKAKGKGKGKK